MIHPARIARNLLFLVACLPLAAVSAQDPLVTGEVPHPSAMQVQQSSTGFTARNDRETLEVTVCGDSLIHVTARPLNAPAPQESQPWMLVARRGLPRRDLPVQ